MEPPHAGDALTALQLKKLVYATSLSLFSFGYNSASISGALLYIDIHASHCSAHRICLVSTFEKSLVVSACLIGGAVGCLMAPTLTEWCGHKRTLAVYANIFNIAGCLLMALTPDIYMLAAGRFVVGMGAGIACAITHVYMGAVVPPERRGEFGTIISAIGSIGILLQALIALLVHRYWRLTLVFGVIPATLQLFVGPRYMVDVASPQRRYSQVWRDLLGTINVGQARIAMVIGVSLQVIQQFTGINVTIYYGPKIFQMLSFSKGSAIMISAFVSITQIIVMFFVAMVIDRIGRRMLIFVGLAAMTVSLICLGLAFAFLSVWPGWLTLLTMIVYRLGFSLSLGPLPFTITAEIFPKSIATAGASFCWSVNWVANFLVSLTFLPLTVHVGVAGTFFIYAGIAAASLVFLKWCLPETSGAPQKATETSKLKP